MVRGSCSLWVGWGGRLISKNAQMGVLSSPLTWWASLSNAKGLNEAQMYSCGQMTLRPQQTEGQACQSLDGAGGGGEQQDREQATDPLGQVLGWSYRERGWFPSGTWVLGWEVL